MTISSPLCPCQDFGDGSSSSIVEPIRLALDSDDRTQTLLHWLSSGGKSSEGSEKNNDHPCGCGPSSAACCCKNRVNASFAILNAIRDACRPFLDDNDDDNNDKKKATSSFSGPPLDNNTNKPTKIRAATTYAESFPALGNITTVGTNKVKGGEKQQKKKGATSKPKRRIRPAVVVSTTDSAAWRQKGNLVNLPIEEEDPYPPPIQVAHRSIATKKKPTSSSDRPTTVFSGNKTNVLTPKKKKQGQNQHRVQQVISTKPPPPAAVSASKTSIKRETRQTMVSDDRCLDRLVELYCTLFHNCLIPSSVLELHLLFRLLAVNEQSTMSKAATANDDDTTTSSPVVSFSNILSSSDRCIRFACCTIRQIEHILRGLGPILFKDLVQCKPFCEHLPDIAERYKSLWQEQQVSMQSVSMSADHTALLTLPFEAERDSRHNFKTRQEQALFKNREECRDAFLYQLRSFLKIRETIVDSSKANQVSHNIRQSSSNVIAGLYDANLPWFVDFFCDMLLQVGHAPIQETDAELLKIIDKDKLQRLHRRFSIKTTRSKRSTKTLVAKIPDRSSPFVAAQRHFPGYQEFFFLFFTSANSYSFSMYLRSLLTRRVRDLSSSARDIGEKSATDMRLLGKFLGLVVFSPNWRSVPKSKHTWVTSQTSLDGLCQLSSCGLSLLEIVHRAVKSHSVSLHVPWIVELLKMSLWDSLALSSKTFTELLCCLRELQLKFANYKFEDPSLVVVSLGLESLFGESVGLLHTVSLKPTRLVDCPTTTCELPRMTDKAMEIAMSSSVIHGSTTHIDEFLALLIELSQGGRATLRSPGVSRKLRPSVVSPAVSSIHSPSIRSPRAPLVDVPLVASSLVPGPTETQLGSFQSKLRDSFFHQHGELKTICEFAVGQALRNIRARLTEDCLSTNIPREVSNEEQLSGLHRDASERCMSFLESNLNETIGRTLQILAPPDTDAGVHEIALSLTVAHGVEMGREMVLSLVSQEINRAKQAVRRYLFEKKPEAVESLSAEVSGDFELLIRATTLINEAIGNLRSLKQQFQEANITLLSLNSHLDRLINMRSTTIPSEGMLRSFFESVLLLDEFSSSLFQWAVSYSQTDASDRWALLSTHCRTATNVMRFARYGLRKLSVCILSEDGLDGILRLAREAGEDESLSALLTDMVTAKLIRPRQEIITAISRCGATT